jgi:hypothetical protein
MALQSVEKELNAWQWRGTGWAEIFKSKTFPHKQKGLVLNIMTVCWQADLYLYARLVGLCKYQNQQSLVGQWTSMPWLSSPLGSNSGRDKA